MKAALVIEQLETQRGSFAGGPYKFQVERGETVALVGPNGCGKSTLLETIAGILPARSGAVRLGEREWSKGGNSTLPPHERRVGLLLQGLGLWPHRTIREQTALVAGAGVDRIAPLAARLELDALLDRRPEQLSGGEAQRAALLRALISDPEVLLIDEPISAQFEEAAAIVRAVIDEETARGKITLIATHRSWEGATQMDLRQIRAES